MRKSPSFRCGFSYLNYPFICTTGNIKTGPRMAKVRVEVDLLKPRLNEVWVGLEHEGSPLIGFTQKV
ncbi:hypothetical protein H5410_004116 [Solanum commersonii]|uniref:Uncharacterized protein n=1 Tax=Solanum commersonii TaxID=4109 RepID=A0A9J6B7J7_SOLCO|nr:hypothetical protein H5410_004116 [Solanum commersonii]